jgi:hypothetical protein
MHFLPCSYEEKLLEELLKTSRLHCVHISFAHPLVISAVFKSPAITTSTLCAGRTCMLSINILLLSIVLLIALFQLSWDRDMHYPQYWKLRERLHW